MESLSKEIENLRALPELDASKMAQWKEIGDSIGKPEIVEEIKNAYLLTSNPLLEEIKKYSTDGNLIELKKCYHKMKSGCGNVGFLRLQKMCEFLEESLRDGVVKEVPLLQLASVAIDSEYKHTLTLLETL